MSRRPDPSSQDGAAAVEMALLLPVLVVLVYGVIEFGVVFAQDLGMGNGAREGARYAASTPTAACNDGSSTDIVRRTRTASGTVLLDTSDVTVEVYVGPDEATATIPGTEICFETTPEASAVCAGSDPGDSVYVLTTYQHPLFIPFGPNRPSFTLEGRAVFRCQYH